MCGTCSSDKLLLTNESGQFLVERPTKWEQGPVTADPDRRMTVLQIHISDINQLPYTGSEEALTVKVVKCSFLFPSLCLHPHSVPKNFCWLRKRTPQRLAHWGLACRAHAVEKAAEQLRNLALYHFSLGSFQEIWNNPNKAVPHKQHKHRSSSHLTREHHVSELAVGPYRFLPCIYPKGQHSQLTLYENQIVF